MVAGGRGLPAGTVTFLFTDIERSTETVAALGAERYADSLEIHHNLLREAFGSHHGHEVGTEGDAFFVAFERPSDAVAAVIDGQRALESHGWPDDTRIRARMGLHTGEALVRGGDYIGFDVHQAKRICDAGHGGQIILSQATADLVSRDVSLKDLGPHRLKDLGEPQRLYQLLAEGLPSDFPSLRSLASFTHNLPAQRTSFIGREREIAEVQALLDRHRLVTLTGVGGCGKTRLAVQVGADSLDRYPDGVFFVDLAPVSDPTMVAGAIATSVEPPVAGELGMPAPSGSAIDALSTVLARARSLLILDNCEHLLDGCAEVVDSIIGHCPDVTVLATSREALDVEGEQTWQIPSLSLSDEAVGLFESRAKSVRPGFVLTRENSAAVSEICRRLDGMPLAIEFAAARVSHLPPQEIASRLDDMFRLLTGGRRRVQRQQTLQAALDWSYELLSAAEQVLLRRLSVFSGSFTIGAVEGICTDGDIAATDVLDLLGSLVAKSLVNTTEMDGVARYRLLETVRVYASEKLRVGGEADVYRTRHRDWYQRWIESFTWDDLHLRDSITLMMEDERANLNAALEWSGNEGRLDLVARMVARQSRWGYLGLTEERARWLRKVDVDALDLGVEERIALLHLAYDASRLELTDPAEDLRSFDEVGSRIEEAAGGEPCAGLIEALMRRAWSRSVIGQLSQDPETKRGAREDVKKAKEIAERRGVADRWSGRLLMIEGVVELCFGDDVDMASEALLAGADADPDPPPGWLLDAIAAAHVAGHHDRALKLTDRWFDGLHRWERRSTPLPFSPFTAAVGVAGTGDISRARELLREGLDVYERKAVRDEGLVGLAIGFAAIAFLSGDPASASRLLAWVRSRTLDAGQLPPSLMAYAIYRHYIGLVRGALDADEAVRHRVEGRSMSEQDVVALALEV